MRRRPPGTANRSPKPARGWRGGKIGSLMPDWRSKMFALFAVEVLCLAIAAASADAQAKPTKPADPMTALQTEVAVAERALQSGERQIAESHYREALYNGWMLTGALAVSEGRLANARDAFERAAGAIVASRDAQQMLAIVELQMGDAQAALPLVTQLVAAYPKQPELRRLLAQALVANRQPEEAVQALEEAAHAAPDDLETTFALASGYLRVKKVDQAQPLFAKLAAARPLPQTYVLIGRAYRDAGYYDRARTALEEALAMDPKVRHAHFYLGTLPVMAEGVVRVEEAMVEFRRELKLAPDDPLANLRLGMALVEAHRESEALGPLQIAAAAPDAGWQAYQYLGRCQLALDRPADAVRSLRKAVDLSAGLPVQARIGNLHYHLAMALRQAGQENEAEQEFTAAAAQAKERTESDREALDRFLQDQGDRPGADPTTMLPLDPGGFGKITADARKAVATQIASALARVYLNLGVMQAQANRFARAGDLFQQAATLDPSLPQVQYSLGVASFNAHDYSTAAAALAKALDQDPSNADARRMLALSAMNTEDYAKAADLLRNDPQREADVSLQFAYGVSLVRSGHAAEAEGIFSKLVAAHADSPELNVVLGQAHAEQGDYDAAVQSLQHALALKPDVAEANAALGVIYLKQGHLAEATQVLEAELKSHPSDARARFTLATVLDLDGHSDRAIGELRTVLAARPDHANARYLLGKILLAKGSVAPATEQLEIAARLAPEDANVHYQLAQAYQKAGRTDLAQRQFEVFQDLKNKRRGGGS
jgi:tetratricopeptide (TPR) repeat protein